MVIAKFAPGPTPGHGEVGQDKSGELRFRELNGNGRDSGLSAGMGTVEWPYLKISGSVPGNRYLQLE